MLEQIRQTQMHQRFTREAGDIGDAPWTVIQQLPTEYEIVQIRNAVVLDWNADGLKEIRVGDRLTEAQAQAVARYEAYEVTVIR